MLTLATLPQLFKIVAKIDVKPILEKIKKLEIFDDVKNSKEAKEALTAEKMGVLAFEVLSELTPQLDKIADDVLPLIATYKDISEDEAKKLNAAFVINELINDEGIKNFFKTALHRKVEQEH